MADGDERATGPTMLCATKVLNTGPTRIGSLFGNVTLPRTVEVRALAAGAAGAVALCLATAAVVGFSFRQIVMSTIVGAALAVTAQTYSPMPGETVWSWGKLRFAARLAAVKADGDTVRVYVGVCPVRRLGFGEVTVVAGAVDVPEGSVDDRGYRYDQPIRPTSISGYDQRSGLAATSGYDQPGCPAAITGRYRYLAEISPTPTDAVDLTGVDCHNTTDTTDAADTIDTGDPTDGHSGVFFSGERSR